MLSPPDSSLFPLAVHAAGDPPAFFAQLTGTSLGVSDLRRRDVFSNAVLFVLGFSAVFALLGVTLNAVLQGVGTEVLTWLSHLAGTVVILLGLHLTGLLRIPFLDREHSVKPRRLKLGYFTSMLFGASFAVAWTPCVGPILGSTLALATSQPASAFPLLLAYAFGLGTPFLLVGLFPSRAFAFIKKHRRGGQRVHTAFSVILIGMGVLAFTSKLACSPTSNCWTRCCYESSDAQAHITRASVVADRRRNRLCRVPF